jgi:TatD DNase family protein
MHTKHQKMLDEAPLARGMYDTHFHSLQMSRRGLDVPQLLARALERGLDGAVDVCVDPGELEERIGCSGSFAAIRYAAGFYPSEATRFEEPADAESVALVHGEKAMVQQLSLALRHPRIVALGEIGLDYYHNPETRNAQRALFACQVELAAARGLPIILHSRESDDDLIDILAAVRPPAGGVAHCFSSGTSVARRLLDLGFMLSFAGNLTYPPNIQIQESARFTPDSALVVETDAPYLAPMPLRGQANQPAFVSHTYGYLAKLRNVGVEALVMAVRENVTRLFG